MKKLLLILLLGSSQALHGYTFKIINCTRIKIAVTGYPIASWRQITEVEPASVGELEFSGIQSGVCVGSFDIRGITQPGAGLSTSYNITGNKCQGWELYVGHQDPQYLNPEAGKVTTVLGGSQETGVSTTQKLPIKPNSGRLVVFLQR